MTTTVNQVIHETTINIFVNGDLMVISADERDIAAVLSKVKKKLVEEKKRKTKKIVKEEDVKISSTLVFTKTAEGIFTKLILLHLWELAILEYMKENPGVYLTEAIRATPGTFNLSATKLGPIIEKLYPEIFYVYETLMGKKLSYRKLENRLYFQTYKPNNRFFISTENPLNQVCPLHIYQFDKEVRTKVKDLCDGTLNERERQYCIEQAIARIKTLKAGE